MLQPSPAQYLLLLFGRLFFRDPWQTPKVLGNVARADPTQALEVTNSMGVRLTARAALARILSPLPNMECCSAS